MKVGFIGTGRMGQAMVRRLLDAKHEVGVYNRTACQGEAAGRCRRKDRGFDRRRRALLARSPTPCSPMTPRWRMSCSRMAGCIQSLPKGGIHICAGTHGIPVIRKIKAAHADKGQVLVAAPMMGRPELVSSGTAGVFASGPAGCARQMQASVRRHRPPHLRGRRRSRSRNRAEDRQQLRARLRHRGDGRRICAHAQVRCRDAGVL